MSAEGRFKAKLTKKLKLRFTPRNSKKTVGSPGVQSPPNGDGAPSGGCYGTKNRSSKSSTMNKPPKPASSNLRKKRIYAGQDKPPEEATRSRFRFSNRESSLPSRKDSNLLRSHSSDEGIIGGKASRSMWVSCSVPSVKLKTMAKHTEMSNARKNSLAKKHSKDSSCHLIRKQDEHAEVPSPKSSRKRQQAKSKANDDPDLEDDQPKRRKRVIRIDPYDISNKRLDDGIVVLEKTKEKKNESEDSVEMSKNAQFRAIQPSPSILSFVEDNLLGRRRTIELRRAGYNTELSAPLDNVPFSTSSERERIEETIFRNKLTFFAAAKVSSSFPTPEVPEIAFAGRSNVGKSSLLNALTRQWGVARTSDKPGLTQTINFFKLGPKLSLVDLPGYGFAYAKEEVKDAWEELVKEYVSSRIGLKQVCLLVDTKWGMKPRDHELIDLMERSETKYHIVLTKTDLVFPIDVARRVMQIEENLKANKSIVQPVMMVSSKSGAGIRSLRTMLAKIARFARV